MPARVLKKYIPFLLLAGIILATPEKEQALTRLGEKIDGDPAMQDLANYMRGRAALANGRAGTARELFEKALQQLPNNEDPLRGHILFHHAVCLEKLKRPQSAEAGLLAALESGYQPESQADALQASRILLRMGQHGRALPLLEAVALHHPNPTPEAWAMLGRSHRAAMQYERAISAYSQSLELSPAQPETLALRAGLYRRLGKFSQAEADYRNALQQAPDDPALHYALGLLKLRTGKIGQAKESLLQASGSETTPLLCLLLIALLEQAQGNLSNARIHLVKYFESTLPAETNETAFYLDYILTTANGSRDEAMHTLRLRAEPPQASAALGAYLAYCTGQKTRKELLDLAGIAASPALAKKQICEAAYWMAQHEQITGRTSSTSELLQISLQNGNPEWVECQLARWQLENSMP